MKKTQNLYLSSVTLLIAGIVMIISNKIGVEISKILVPILFISTGIFNILFGKANLEQKTAAQYFILQGIALIIFGLSIGFGANNLESFLSYVTYFIMFIGLSDIIFSFVLVNSQLNWTWGRLLFKTAVGFIGLTGGVAILATSAYYGTYSGLMTTGAVTILLGIGTVIFASKAKQV